MNDFRVAMLLAVLALASAAAQAQAPVRVRGDITGVEGNVVSVRSREGGNLNIEITPNTTFAYMKRLRLEDVKPGTPLGTSAVKGPDGKLIARELHIFPENRPIPNEGHRPWDLEPGSTMTNARVSALAQATGGREITLTYKEGSQQVIVPADVPVVMAVESDRSLLKAGEYAVFAVTQGADGRITATRVQVTRDGVRPPT
jgi:hypothetical protein